MSLNQDKHNDNSGAVRLPISADYGISVFGSAGVGKEPQLQHLMAHLMASSDVSLIILDLKEEQFEIYSALKEAAKQSRANPDSELDPKDDSHSEGEESPEKESSE